jgi:hypothetical protein
MKIRINGADADIRPETEQTVGEILSALDVWLNGTGHRLSGLGIDGEVIHSGAMENSFGRNIDTVQTLDIITSPVLELFGESLAAVIQDIAAYEAAVFEEKGTFLRQWKESPEARLLSEQSPELFNWTVSTFSGEGSGPQALRIVIEERLREVEDPAGETGRIRPLIAEICTRLEELPLDIQTGKDARAAETVKSFSGIAEKLFRIFKILQTTGFPVQEIAVEGMPVSAYIEEFDTALRELLAAYEQHDTILVGDLAEYEMAPRLRNLHTAVLNALAMEGEDK